MGQRRPDSRIPGALLPSLHCPFIYLRKRVLFFSAVLFCFFPKVASKVFCFPSSPKYPHLINTKQTTTTKPAHIILPGPLHPLPHSGSEEDTVQEHFLLLLFSSTYKANYPNSPSNLFRGCLGTI